MFFIYYAVPKRTNEFVFFLAHAAQRAAMTLQRAGVEPKNLGVTSRRLERLGYHNHQTRWNATRNKAETRCKQSIKNRSALPLHLKGRKINFPPTLFRRKKLEYQKSRRLKERTREKERETACTGVHLAVKFATRPRQC